MSTKPIEANRPADCIACKATCCRHVATGIDTPAGKKDYDNIRWYLMHENVRVFIDTEDAWTLEFVTLCNNLSSENTCSKYSNRPKICSEYPDSLSWCEYESDELPYKVLFTSAQEFEEYLDKNDIMWRHKNMR